MPLTRCPASALMLVVGALGCGGGSSGPDAEKTRAAVDVAAVNALVPKDRKLEFEAVVTAKKRAVAVVPKGWKAGFMEGQLEPPDGSGFGFATSFTVSTSCDGECKSKDWEKELTEGHLKQFAGDKPRSSEKVGENGWLVKRGQNANSHDGLYVQWKKGGSKYQTCQWSLSQEDEALEPAFEKACLSLVGLRWDWRSDRDRERER